MDLLIALQSLARTPLRIDIGYNPFLEIRFEEIIENKSLEISRALSLASHLQSQLGVLARLFRRLILLG